MYDLKINRELCVMTMKNDTKIEEKLTFRDKIDMNFTNFDPSTRSLKIFFYFNSLLVTKIYIA